VSWSELTREKRNDKKMAEQRSIGRKLLQERSLRLQELADQKRFQQWIEFGCYFGYPDCCIEFFCTEWIALRTSAQEEEHTKRHFRGDRILCHACAGARK
jgi:hypothetical protein